MNVCCWPQDLSIDCFIVFETTKEKEQETERKRRGLIGINGEDEA